VTNNTSGTTVDVTIASIPPGDSVTVTYTGILSVNVQPGQTIPNIANVTYTSLPGTGTPANPTGSVTPGGSGAADGERNFVQDDPVNDYGDSDVASVTLTRLPLFEKSLIATNQSHTSGLNVAIGEIVTYELVLTLPEGTMPNVALADVLDAGLALVNFVSITPSSGDVTTSIPGVPDGFAQILAAANAGIPGNDSSFTLNFGTLINANTDNDVTETLTVVYRAVVLNTIANARGFSLDNDATFTWAQGGASDSADPVVIVEPTLAIDKLNGDPILGQAGDVITFQIVVQHAPGSDADAFDVVLTDLIDSVANKMTYVAASVSVVDAGGAVQAPGSPDESGGDLVITWTDFPLGASSTITFDVTLDITVNPEETLTNEASVTWTSLPGDVTTPQASNPNSVERTGDPGNPGELNNYAESDSGIVTVSTIQPAKSIVATSEAHTTGNDVAVGEIVRYRLQTTLVEGTQTNLQLVDTLPLGLTLLDVGEVRVSFTSDLAMGLAGDLTGANNNAVPPTFVSPPARIATTTLPGGQQQITFDLGTVVNNDNDANIEFVTLEFNALVTNTAAVNNGDVKSNAFQVLVGGTQFGATQSTTVTVREPLIENVSKTVIGGAPVDAGDPVTYQVSFSNTGATTAFDVRLLDILNPALFASVAVDSIVLGGGAAGATDNTLGTTVDVTIDSVPVGGTVTVQYTGVLSVNVQPGQTILNTANVTYTSLPGLNGTVVNPTGSATPGGSGDPNGERDGSGGVNDYGDSDVASVTLTGQPLFEKTLAGSNQSFTTDPQLTIGEQAIYQLVLTLPEGTMPNVSIADMMPAGLELVAFDSITPSSPAVTTSIAGGFPQILIDANNALIGNNTSFLLDFGTLTNSDTNDLVTETLTIVYRAVVLDDVSNFNAQTKTNDATFTWASGRIDDDTTITIVEPQLTITKDAVPLTVVGGDTITFTITVDHTGLSTSNAFDVRITDVIPAGLTYVGNVTPIIGPNPTVSLSLPTVEFFWATIPLGAGPYQFTFQVTVDATVQAGNTFANTANLVWSTLPGVDPNERTYTDSDDAPTITANPAASNPSKSIVATSEPSTLGNDVTIGEIVRYRLQAQFTGGTFPNVTLVDTLPAGLTFLNDGNVRVSFTADTPWTLEADLVDASNSAVPPTFVLPAGRIGVLGQAVTFDLGTITNNDGDANLEFVTIEFNARVANVGGNVAGVTLSNAFDLFVDGGQVGTTQATTVEIVEPQLTITKDAVPLSVVGGDTITFTITVDHTGLSTSDAFDVRITDVIPAGLTYVGNVTPIIGPGPTVSLSLPTVEFFWATIPLGDGPYQFTFQVTVDATVQAGNTFANTANLVWSTLPGVDPNERTYTDSDDAPTITANPAASNPSKSIVATSEPSTLGNDVTIGEIVRYRLQAQFTGGTFPNVTLVDTLPAGLTFLNDGNVRVSFTADTPWTLEADLVDASNSAVPPTFVLPAGRIGVLGQAVTFDLGTITNNDGDANLEFVTIEFNARVANVGGNVSGVTLSNAFDLFVDGGQVGTTQATTVEIVEPQLTITKDAVPLSVVGGDTITFTITVDHTGLSTSDAFDVRITDVIPAGLTYVGNVTPIIGPGPTVSLSLPTVEFFWATIPLGAGPYQFTFQVTVDATVQAGNTFVNTANLVWSTLPGVDPNERTYTDSDDAPTITANPAASNPSKSIVATSEPSTLGNDVTIGEIVRYRLQAQFTGGTFPNVTLVDTLPAGLTFLNDGNVRVSFTADTPWTLEADLVDASNSAVPPTFVLPAGRIGVLGQAVTFDLGTITNNDGDANLEFVTIEFNARVANVGGNVAGVTLSNAFDLFVDGGQVGTTQATTVEIVEPQLTITKDAVPLSVVGGDTITFTITVDHTGLSTSDAFDVRITDVIPAGLTYVGNVTPIIGPGPTVSLSLPTVEFFWATIPLGAGPYQFTFQVTVDATVQAGNTFVNTANLVWSTLPGVDPNERTYTDSDDAPTITANPAASNPSKSIVATSEPSTLGNDVTIGEIVRYRLQAQFTGGTFPNVTLEDTLPAGLTFLNDGNVRVSFTADNPWTLEADLVDASNNAVPPTFVLPAGRISVAGQAVTFDLGTITNNDGDANLEFVTIEFNARVANVGGNVAGVTLSNAFDLFVDGGQVGTTQATTVEIVEPQLTITKDAVPLSVVGGDTITFTITVDHTGLSTSDAFDVRITDVIPAGLTYVGNVTPIIGPGPTVSLSLPTVEFFWATIPLGAGPYQFTFQVTVDATVQAGNTFVNTANLVWSTLPGVDPNERTYTDSDDAPTITANPAASNPSKSIVATSEPSTLGNDVTIGEIVRYRLQAQFTGGTFPNVTLVDTLPAGLTFLNDGNVRVSFTADTPWTLEADLVDASNSAVPPTFVLPAGRIGVLGQAVTFDLGTITNNDGDANLEFVTIEFNARVANVGGNVAGVTLSNAFDLFVDGGQVGTTQATTVEIVEPQLRSPRTRCRCRWSAAIRSRSPSPWITRACPLPMPSTCGSPT
jgi:large repetitive protein